MYRYAQLSAADLPCYAPLLIAPQDQVVDAVKEGEVAAVGVSFCGRPRGVAMARRHGDHAHLLDLVVAPPYRNNGIGTRLLAALEEVLRAQGCRGVDLLYPTGDDSPALERVLAKRGWSTPTVRYQVFWSDASLVDAPFIQRFRLPAGYEIFPWVDLSAAALATIHQRHKISAGGWYPAGLAPDIIPAHLCDPATSLGLRYRGEVVGWMLTRPLSPGVLIYDTLFVSPALQRLGRGFMLLAEAIRRQQRQGGRAGVWRVRPTNRAMLRFVEKHMGPWLSDRYEERWAHKPLASAEEWLCDLAPV